MGNALKWALALALVGCADAPSASDAGALDAAFADVLAARDAGQDPDLAPIVDGAPARDASGDPDWALPDAAPDGPAALGCETVTPGLKTVELDHDGRRRTYAAHLPARFQPGMAAVIDLHGRTQTAEAQNLLSNMRAVAEAEGFIAVHPTGGGSDSTWNAGVCCGAAMTENVDDVGFLAAVIDDLAARYCADPARMYVTGMSNGGFTAHRMGCERADKVTAIAPVAGTLGVFECDPARPVPVLHFHGTGDEIVPYDGFFGFASVEITVDAWVAANGCAAGPEIYFEEADVRCERWSGCDGDADVQLCTIEDGGHTWPGGPDVPFFGRTTRTISASQEMWRFFRDHRR